MITTNHFKRDFFDAIFKISKKTFPVLLLTIISIYIFLGIIGAIGYLLISFGGLDFDVIPFGILDFVDNPFTAVSFILPVFLLLYLFFSWIILIQFFIVDFYIKNNTINISRAFQKSFTPKVLTVYFMIILFMVLYLISGILGVLPIVAMSSISFPLALIVGFIVVVAICSFLFKFLLAMPHIINTNCSSSDSLLYSYDQINFKSSLKYTFIFVVAYISFAFVSFLLNLIVMAFGDIGFVIMVIVQVGLFSFLISLVISTVLGLYYLYNPEILPNEERLNAIQDFDGNLIIEDEEDSLELIDDFE